MKPYLLLFPVLMPLAGLLAQTTPIPAEVKPFVLPAHEVLDYVTGDLNGDSRPDAILILKDKTEDSSYETRKARPLLLLIRQAKGGLQQVLRNDSAVMGRNDGGVMGDPYQETAIRKNSFTLFFYGGSSWRWSYEYRFAWKPALKNWYLVSEKQSSFNSGDPEKTTKEIAIGEAELGKQPFSHFSPGSLYQETRWKVQAAKTFFYNNPQAGSVPRKAYLLKGNTVKGTRTLTHFIEVEYENSKGEITEGFLLRKDLVPLQ